MGDDHSIDATPEAELTIQELRQKVEKLLENQALKDMELSQLKKRVGKPYFSLQVDNLRLQTKVQKLAEVNQKLSENQSLKDMELKKKVEKQNSQGLRTK